jgi:sucrose phosphorylase
MPGSLKRAAADPFRALEYLPEPDYAQPLRGLPPEIAERVRRRVAFLYGEERADTVTRHVDRLVRVQDAYATPEIRATEAAFVPRDRFNEKDAVLITYGDLVVSEGRSPLRTLSDFALVFFRGLVTTVHVLPFFPSSSDRGFSVISYEEVDPRLGSWEEIARLGRGFRLMFDGVFNHISAKSRRFQRFLAGDPEFERFFRVFSSRHEIDDDHLKLVLRPRTSDLLNEFPTVDGPRWLWTTFSRDQIDVNFRHPRVLLDVLEILLYYVRRGADLVRLDAVTYIWHELGTSCAHLRQTHEVVKLVRDVLDAAAPHVALVTETNVPHADNVTYFGDGTDEAQLVYNFALPPLVLHSFVIGSAATLSEWAASLVPPSETTAFFNFLDSHDGIGLMGARGILPEEEIARLCERVRSVGGLVSMRTGEGGVASPYELNVTWWSALNDAAPGEDLGRQVDRFVAARAIALSLRGVPGIYLLSFFGSRNDLDAVQRDGQARSINRSALREEWLFDQFSDPASIPSRTASRFIDLLGLRAAEPAFHPAARQDVLRLDPRLLVLVRTPTEGRGGAVVAIVDVSGEAVETRLSLAGTGLPEGPLVDLVSGVAVPSERGEVALRLRPYQVVWLKGAGV